LFEELTSLKVDKEEHVAAREEARAAHSAKAAAFKKAVGVEAEAEAA